MIYLKRMFYRRWITLFFAIVFIILFVALPYGFYQSLEAQFIVSDAIEQMDRGSYDLLVRPGSTTRLETNMRKVDTSFAINNIQSDILGNYTMVEGFSMEQWLEIMNDPRVEVAAPIATVGFMESISQYLLIPVPSSNGEYHVTINYYTTDGLNDYLLDTQYHNITGDVFEEEIASKLPNTHHLLVAVDPEAEQELTGINFTSLLESPPLKRILNQEEVSIVRLMQRNQLTTPLSARIEIEDLQGENHQVIEVNLTNFLQPFTGEDIRFLSPDSLENTFNDKNQFSQLSPNFLLTDLVEYGSETIDQQIPQGYDGELFISPVSFNKVPVYRKQVPVGAVIEGEINLPFIDSRVESFEPPIFEDDISPLGIYSIPEVITEDGKRIFPTAHAGSFIAQTASGVISLDVAQQIKGPHFMDAIRIRVIGDETYTSETRKRINTLARDLRNMRYDVAIVSGSALKPQAIDVQGIGHVEIPSIRIGILTNLARDFDVSTLTTVTLFTVFALTWVFCRLKTEKSLLQEESTILAYMGWSENQIKKHELKSQQIFLIFLNAISLCILFVFQVPSGAYLISIGLLLTSLCIPYIIYAKFKIDIWSKPFNAGQAVHHYWEYYRLIIILLWISYQVISIITASHYRVFSHFEATEVGQSLITPVNSLMVLLMILAYVMTVFATFESISLILRERKDEFILYQLVGWKQRHIYLHLVKESIGWMGHPLLSAAAISIIISICLSFLIGGTLIVLFLSGFILGCLNMMTDKKNIWTVTTWNWAILGVTLIVSITLGRVYSPVLVLPILYVSVVTLFCMSTLIFITMYFSLKKFYRSI